MMSQDFPSQTNSPFAPVALESIRITLELYRSGKSGIPYNQLQQFAAPILVHYQLDLGSAFTDEVSQDNLESMTLLLDVLETATLFWEFCSLESGHKQDAVITLRENLLGASPSADDMAQFPLLIATMEKQWDQVTAGSPTPTASPSSFTDSFSAPDNTQHLNIQTYGPENLETPEAFALFARPMLDNEAFYEDPDLLDEIMTRSEAYWDLAHLPATKHPTQIEKLLCKFASSSIPRPQLKKEIDQMLSRFHELFPEHK